MEDIGNYLYIIFLVLIFIANALFGKKKKDQRRPSQETEPVGDEKTFEEILEDIFKKEEKKPVGEDKTTVKPMARPVKPMEEQYKSQHPEWDREKVEKMERKSGYQGGNLKKELKEEKAFVNEFQEYMESVKGKDRKSTIVRDQAALEIIELGTKEEKVDLELNNFNMKKAIVYNAILQRKYE